MESSRASSAGGQREEYAVGNQYVIHRYHQSLDNNSVRLLHFLPQIGRCIVELPGGVELSVPPNVLVPRSAGSTVPAANAPAQWPKVATYLKIEQLAEVVPQVVFTEYAVKNPPKRLEPQPVPLTHTTVSLIKPPGYLQPRSKTDVGNLIGLSVYQRNMVAVVVDRLRSPASSFFLAEGVGVGKTRILAGVIAAMDAPQSNRHMWLGASENLRGIQQELAAIRTGGVSLYPLGFEREIGPILHGPGVLHCQYTQFASTGRRNGIRRLDSIINWLKQGYGVIVLDDFTMPFVKPNVSTHLGELTEALQNKVKIVYASQMLFFQNSDLALCRQLLQNTLNSQNVLVKSDTAIALNHAGVLSCAFSDLKNVRIQARDIPTASVIANLVDQSYVLWADLWRTLCELQASGRLGMRPSEDSDDERTGDVAGGPKRAYWVAHAEYFRSLSLIAKIPAIKDLVTAASIAGKKTAVSLFYVASEGRADSPKEIIMRTLRTIFPELHGMQLTQRPLAAHAANALSGAGRPKRKMPDAARLPYVPSFTRGHAKVDRFGVRVIEMLQTPRFSASTNTAAFQAPRREFSAVKTKRALYKVAPKLGPLAELSDDSDAENLAPGSAIQASSQPSVSTLRPPQTVQVKDSEPSVDLKVSQNFIDKVNALPSLPTFSAVDLLIDALGGSTVVAEMSARKTHVLNKMFVRRSDSENTTQLAAFVAGTKKVAVVNDLSCIGYNLNCEVNILAEMPLMPLRGLQQICRGYTAAAKESADVVLLSSKLGGERFMAGGLIDSLEQFRTGGDPIRGKEVTKPFFYDQARAKLALDYVVAMCYNPPSYRGVLVPKPNHAGFLKALAQILEPLGWIPGVERRHDSGARFLQRIYGLPIETQDHVFAYFASVMEQVR